MADRDKMEKLSAVRSLGINPYPYSYDVTAKAGAITSDYGSFEGKEVSSAGRIIGRRNMGKLVFLDILDGSGRIQVMAAADALDDVSARLIELIDLGDIIGVSGTVTKTEKGEISIKAASITMLSKSLRMMPEKFHGLSDTELRYRKRYLDLIANTGVRRFFTVRSDILRYMRNFLDDRGYIEFETPVLQPTYGGANAKPFKTHYEALESDVYLRVANELYLKRLVIGGFEKVYEVSKDFRNEDIDTTHNPEFTQIECYEAYKDYNNYMSMTEELVGGLVEKLFGSSSIEYQGKKIDFGRPFARVRWTERLEELSGINVVEMDDDAAKKIAKKEGLDVQIVNAYHVADALFDKYVRPDLWSPTFVVDFPSYMCPLTKTCRNNPGLSERFELYIARGEMANCYSELTDPIEQRKRFDEQEKERAMGDTEAPPSDSEFLEAIEYGMPPTAGIGISIDRIAMILTNNTSIKEVLAFPAMRPQKGNEDKNPSLYTK